MLSLLFFGFIGSQQEYDGREDQETGLFRGVEHVVIGGHDGREGRVTGVLLTIQMQVELEQSGECLVMQGLVIGHRVSAIH